MKTPEREDVTILNGILSNVFPNEAACPIGIAKYVWDHLEALNNEREIRTMRRYLNAVPLITEKLRRCAHGREWNLVEGLATFWVNQAQAATEDPGSLLFVWSNQNITIKVKAGQCDEAACGALERIINQHASLVEALLEDAEAGDAHEVNPDEPIGSTPSS